MSRNRWHMLRDDDSVTLARRVPVRFDLVVRTKLPAARKDRIAHQIRQDLWRALRGLRGFAPAVQVTDTQDGLTIAAGGEVSGRFPQAEAESRLRAVLEDAANRARWVRCAT
ncbi:hypothetical protein G5B38_18485 [Pseudohalocynthiibacter aestuariivivens]|uniref:Uncharacterized protein n=1 Tax=Roseovarius pelagicus TaxID=2980108 RepID=A0ABY6DD57_9RHOB|nr:MULTISPECIES: hypothetical protein [Rhodobacterales]QIE47350.1 hypothetical protein G5B38_18485 [Pseudohalocynthiibacter aestuariivivens]UXX84089.1 hypothetical protein N7U68_05395 [Roseovarius pelagicus]